MALEEISKQITLENLHGRLARVEDSQQQVVTRLGALETRMDKRFDEVLKRLDSIEKRLPPPPPPLPSQTSAD